MIGQHKKMKKKKKKKKKMKKKKKKMKKKKKKKVDIGHFCLRPSFQKSLMIKNDFNYYHWA